MSRFHSALHPSRCSQQLSVQRCCSTDAESGFVPISAQFFAVGTRLLPEVSRIVCFVQVPAPKRSGWTRCFAITAKANLSWAKYESLIHADVQNLTPPTTQHYIVLPFLTRCSLGLNLCVVSRFVDDRWCVPQVRFNIQVLSSVICSDSKQTVQQQKTFRI